MDAGILLGSTVRMDIGTNAKEGMLVMRQSRNAAFPPRLTIEVGDTGHPDHHSISFCSSMYDLQLLSAPAPGSMLVMYGIGSPMERVRHLAPGRLAALDWLEEHRPDWREHGDIAIVPAHADEPKWLSPVPLHLVPSRESEAFRDMPDGTTGIPVGDAHPGAFGFRRRHHVHEGVDLYVPEGTPVSTVEGGRVVSVIPFTGSIAVPSTPFWNDTWAVLVEGASGTVVYGEIDGMTVSPGDELPAGATVGFVRRVLIKEKTPPRPMSMLHLELHRHGTDDAYEWPVDGPRPESLLDPTEMLLSTCLHG
jgi:hypothetical protein